MATSEPESEQAQAIMLRAKIRPSFWEEIRIEAIRTKTQNAELVADLLQRGWQDYKAEAGAA